MSYDPRLTSSGSGGVTADPVAVVVQIEGLPFEFTLSDHDITEVVTRYGPVTGVQALDSALAPDVMLVEFETSAAAQECVDHLEGLQINVDGQQAVLRVKFFDESVDRTLQRKLEAAVASAESLKDSSKWQCRFILGGDEMSPQFPIAQRVLGVGGAELRRISEFSGARVRLRGRRSNLRDGGEETDEPLHLAVQTSDEIGYRRACEIIEHIMGGVYADYAHFCQLENLPYRPIQLLCVEGPFHEDLDSKLALFRSSSTGAPPVSPLAPPVQQQHQHHHQQHQPQQHQQHQQQHQQQQYQHQHQPQHQPHGPGHSRMKYCRLWMTTGACHYGDRCQYAHLSNR